MLSGTVPFCYHSKVYSKIDNFEKNIIQFSSIEEFNEKLNYYLGNEKLLKQLSKQVRIYGLENHTWKIRAKQFYEEISSF